MVERKKPVKKINKKSKNNSLLITSFVLSGISLFFVLILSLSILMGNSSLIQRVDKVEMFLDDATQGMYSSYEAKKIDLSKVEIEFENEPILGDKNAPLTMFEFSDYQCPFCRKFYEETYPKIKEKYVDTGLLKIVFKDFPLESLGHIGGIYASKYANCLREQTNDETYFKFHDIIFEEQAKQGQNTIQFGKEELDSWIKIFNIDKAKLDVCVESEETQQEMEFDIQEGGSIGVRGTPAFLIQDELVEGAYPFSEFERIIESKLNR